MLGKMLLALFLLGCYPFTQCVLGPCHVHMPLRMNACGSCADAVQSWHFCCLTLTGLRSVTAELNMQVAFLLSAEPVVLAHWGARAVPCRKFV